jgi:hypothetical protein
MSTLSIRQRLSELKAEFAAIGAKLRMPSADEALRTQSGEQATTPEQAAIVQPSPLGGTYPYVVRRPRPLRYY